MKGVTSRVGSAPTPSRLAPREIVKEYEIVSN